MLVDGRYQTEKRLVDDASGTLWRGRDERLNRPVTIKVFEGSPAGSPRWARFVREARILGSLNAPGLVPLYDVNIDAEPPYMVMAPLQGQSLEERLQEHGRLPVSAALDLIETLLETVEVAHALGFVHRDICPSHVWFSNLDAKEQVKLLGFGRVRAAGETGTFSDVATAADVPAYAPPELFLEDRIDPRSDVFGVASVGYHALTGQPPVDLSDARNVADVVTRIMSETPPPPSKVRSEIPPALDDLFRRGLAKMAKDRFSTARAFRLSLQRVRARATTTPDTGTSIAMPPVGAKIDGYRVVGALGSGGMGTVLLADDLTLDRRVAVKLLHSLSDRRRERFVDEARAMARIQHPNVVQVFAFGHHDDTPYLVMEHVPGRSVEDAIRNGLLPLGDALCILDQTAAGIDAVHRAGLTHGDVKPSNVLIGPAFRVAVADFGLSRGAAEWASAPAPGGTPGYLAPECRAGQVDPTLAPKVDAYALAVMAHELLTGVQPSADEVPVRPSSIRAELAVFDDAVLAALDEDPAARSSCRKLRHDLAAAARLLRDEAGRVFVVGPASDARELLVGELEDQLPSAVVSIAEESRIPEGVDVVFLVGLADPVPMAADLYREFASPPPFVVVARGDVDVQHLAALGVRAVLPDPVDPASLRINLKRLLRV
ncbi:MAG: serine/threonine-protein kinase [Myxococcota bacterium]